MMSVNKMGLSYSFVSHYVMADDVDFSPNQVSFVTDKLIS